MEATAKERNWSEEESMMLMELVRERKGVIDGKFSSSVTMEAKRNAWRSITDSLNSMYTNQVRQWANVKKRYSNIKQSAKNKHSQIKYPPTGNKGPVIVLKPEETEFLNDNDGAPSIDGIAGGMETITTEEEIEVADDIVLLLQQVEKPKIETPTPTATRKRKCPESKQDRLWNLDVTVQELKIKKLNLEIEILELKKKKLLKNEC